jgi:hypothetical protein
MRYRVCRSRDTIRYTAGEQLLLATTAGYYCWLLFMHCWCTVGALLSYPFHPFALPTHPVHHNILLYLPDTITLPLASIDR